MPYIGQEPVAGNFVLLDAITTSATATYALTKNSVAYSPESSRNMIVSLNGVTQAPETAYTVSGSNITFSSALTASDVIDYILVLGDVLDIGRPSDGVVGTDQMNYPLGNFSSTGIDDNATSTAITIDASENVGIGTTSPSTALHIDTGTTNDAIRLVSTDADVNILMGDNTGSVRLQNSGGDFVAYTGTSAFGGFAETMRIDSSGNVGIGTASPTQPLDISASMASAGSGPVVQVTETSGGARNGIHYTSTATTNSAVDLFKIEDAVGTRFIVKGGGNVGIGTTAPAQLLDVSGTAIFGGSTTRLTTYSDSTYSGIFNGSALTSDEAVYMGGDSIFFYGGGTERMRILSSGGITFNGDTAAANALDDYEEGTWTPTFSGYTGTTYTSSGFYTKVGRLVTLHFGITISSIGTFSSNSRITGLPFAAGTSTSLPSQPGILSALNATRDDQFFDIYATSSDLYLYSKDGTPYNGNNWQAGTISGTYTYFTS